MAARSQRFGPSPVEFANRFETPDMGRPEAALEAAACPLLLFPIEQFLYPFGAARLRPMRQQTIQIERLGAGAQGVEVIHRVAP